VRTSDREKEIDVIYDRKIRFIFILAGLVWVGIFVLIGMAA
jgi:hypothetical protein